MLTMGQIIKARRLELVWTQRDLAIKLGWPVPEIEKQGSPRLSNYENDTRSLKTSDLNAISKVLGVSVSYSIGEVENPLTVPAFSHSISSAIL